ncbi:putative septum site-determining protein MinC OS=Castellaniella defragrans OX=75697 GN=minC PE=3 SV=1 [Castellaniella denitrificans]|uniref:septum site-determining protein MinC n=1 Tax=Castellaniella sp. TaxID=1955812 RepID=UPI002AFF0FFC|nr:septum site-determining protein MinC [Castellaniella sp.]
MAKTAAVLDFKSASLHVLRAVLHTADTAELTRALDQRMLEAGAFYENEPVVLDAQGLDQAPDWRALADALRRHRLHPIGVRAPKALLASADEAGLAPLDISTGRQAEGRAAAPAKAARAASAPEAPDTPAPASAGRAKPAAPAGAAAADNEPSPPAGTETPAAETLVIRHPLRSGQRIYARGGDLIVMGMVSQGAEVIADGHIHVYGPLRGKAMAGARGNPHAMILTTQLDPELLAIAGVYRVVETRLPDSLHNRPAQVELDGDTLRIRALQGGH